MRGYHADVNLVARVVSVLFAAAVLTACGSIHPGAAVVVDGESISMKTLDERAEVMCLVSQATSQQTQPTDNATVRRNAAGMLVLERIAAEVVKDQNLTIDQDLVALPSSTQDQVSELFGDRADDVLDVLNDQQRLYAQFVAIGAAQTGRTPNADILDPLAQEGQTYVQDAFADHGVEFASRLGMAEDGSVLAGFGSLSVSPPDADTSPATALATCSS